MEQSCDLDDLLQHTIKAIQDKPGVCNLTYSPREPASQTQLILWEQKNKVLLPEDIKAFYLTMDGMEIDWSVKMGDAMVHLGHLYINSISNLTPVRGISSGARITNTIEMTDLDPDEDSDEITAVPRFDGTCSIIQLDPCSGLGCVCLVFEEGSDKSPEVWFLDVALRWHFLSHSFTAYFRLLLLHLGLPQWQYSLTDIGLSQQAMQWFQLYLPSRLAINNNLILSGQTENTDAVKLDVNRVFKGKQDKRKAASVVNTSATGNAQAGLMNKRRTPVSGTASRMAGTMKQTGFQTSAAKLQK